MQATRSILECEVLKSRIKLSNSCDFQSVLLISEPQKLIIAISRIQVTDIEPNDF